MKRRALLATIGLALSGAVGGCQNSAETNPPPEDIRLRNLRYQNRDRRSYRLHVMLLEDSEPVYWTTTEVVPAETQADGNLLVQGREFAGYPTTPAPYELYARLGNDQRSEWVSTDFRGWDYNSGNHEYRCFDVELVIEDGELDLFRSLEGPDNESC